MDTLSRKAVRAALRAWGNSRALGELPMAGLALVDRQRQSAGLGDSAIGYGIAVRDVLRLAIEGLRPNERPPDPLKRRWRHYVILSQQYLDGRSPDYVAEQMGLARSTYDHDQAAAIEALSGHLREQEAHLAALAEGAVAVMVAGEAVRPRPFLAPPRPGQALVGREDLIDELRAALLAGGESPAVVLSGLPGVGKTALALTLAHDSEVLQRFDEGVLWVGLGKTPDLASLMGLWTSPLGLTEDELTRYPKLEDRAKAIHAAIGMRRLLIVIDDVWQAAEGSVFKIGGPNCAHLFTTRMPGVAADLSDGRIVRVHELNQKNGLEVLRGFAPEIVDSEPEEMAGLVDLVGGLPLALVLMGRHLSHAARSGSSRRSSTAVESLKQASVRVSLAKPQTPLDHQPSLKVDQPHTLELIVGLSVDDLSRDAAQALRALAVIPAKPNTFSEPAGLEVGAMTTAALDELLDSGLLEEGDRGRFTMHQVISEVLQGPRRDDEGSARLVAHFVRYAKDHANEDDVLDRELRNIGAALDTALERRMDGDFIAGAVALTRYLEGRGLYDVAASHLERAEAAARRTQDEARLVAVLAGLGRIAQRRGDYGRAAGYFEEALDIVRRDPASSLRAEVLQGAGVTSFSRGNFTAAEEYYRQALEVGRVMGQGGQVTAALANLGTLALSRGDSAAAESYFNEGLAMARKRGDSGRAGAVLMNLGVIAARRGDRDVAEARFQESLELARSRGNRPAMCTALTNMGTLASDEGDASSAERNFVEALDLAREMGDRARTSQLLANLGALETSRKEYAKAESFLQEGLSVARDMGHRENLTLLLNNLGVLERERGRTVAAEHAFREALDLAVSMGHVRYRCVVLGNWGALHLGEGDLDAADAAFHTSLDLSLAAGLVESAAEASFGQARVARARGDLELARRLAAESQDAFDSLHHRRAAEVAAWLRELA